MSSRISSVHQTLTTIGHLPPEILSAIFLLVAPPDPENHQWPARRWHSRPWHEAVDLSLVCRTWRSLALKTPGIWTYIRSLKAHQVRHAAKRAGLLPITIWIDEATRFQEFQDIPLEMVAEQTAKLIVVLNLPDPYPPWPPIQLTPKTSYTHPMPKLQSLAVRVETQGGSQRMEGYQSVIPYQAIDAAGSALRELRLEQCFLPKFTYYPDWFPRLEKFYLRNAAEPAPKASLLISALAAMPALLECQIFLSWASQDHEPDTLVETRQR